MLRSEIRFQPLRIVGSITDLSTANRSRAAWSIVRPLLTAGRDSRFDLARNVPVHNNSMRGRMAPLV